VPRYDYFCPANGRVVEVRHGVDEKLTSWGDVCDRAALKEDVTARSEPVERLIHPPALAFPQGDVALKNQGFTKLVRRETGVYENVTARDGQARIVSPDSPASALNLSSTVTD
jgi:hypothetical protein